MGLGLAPSLVACALLLGAFGAPAQAQGTSSKGYIEMPLSEDGSYVLTAKPGSGRNWGLPVFVRWLVMVSREWVRRHPEGPVLRIGDMSKPDGTTFPPHKTHKDGLTADLFTSPKNACHVNFPDQGLTEELAQLMYDLGARQILYNGERVVKAIPVAQKWPKHDDHFHVVIDPSRVPASGALLALPQPGSRTGDWIGGGRVDEEGKGLILAWRVLGQAKLKSVRVQVDDTDEGNGILHDSGQARLRQPAYKLPIAVTTGQTLRWRVQIELAGQEELLESSWQTLQVDLSAPKVEARSPKDKEKIDARPSLNWRYEKPGVAQRRYWIELDKDPDHKRVWVKLGPFEGSVHSAELPPKLRLKRSKTYHWRVRVEGAHGNLAESEWARFKTSSGYGKKKRKGSKKDPPATRPQGRVSANALNLRRGPGVGNAVLTSLPKGTLVSILGESSGWLEVEAVSGGKTWRGFVSAKFIQR